MIFLKVFSPFQVATGHIAVNSSRTIMAPLRAAQDLDLESELFTIRLPQSDRSKSLLAFVTHACEY